MGNNSIKTFKDIVAWNKAHRLVLMVYEITENYPKCEEYCLKPHTRKTAISIPSNIAEGFKRKSKADSIRFYNIADGSLEELKYQLLLGKDLDYINNNKHNNVMTLADEVGRTLSGWMKSQKLFKD